MEKYSVKEFLHEIAHVFDTAPQRPIELTREQELGRAQALDREVIEHEIFRR